MIISILESRSVRITFYENKRVSILDIEAWTAVPMKLEGLPKLKKKDYQEGAWEVIKIKKHVKLVAKITPDVKVIKK